MEELNMNKPEEITMTLEEFANRVGYTARELYLYIVGADQYGAPEFQLPQRATYKEWKNLACDCDLLYGDVCHICNQLNRLEVKQYELKRTPSK